MADENILAKYKRLLALARNSLEANQASLAAKDKQISQLTLALDEERATAANNLNRKQRNREQDELSSLIPRNLLRRLDVYDQIWILVEYDGAPDAWISFNSEEDLNDYIQRIPGAPLIKPHRCLSEEESAKVEKDAKLKIDRIVEEFRRYKVKVEISKKQKDSIPKQQQQQQQQLSKNDGSSYGNEMVMANDTLNYINNTDHNNNNITHLENDLKKWITAYELIARENEQLRTQANDSLLVKKWQERYEEVMKEKEDLVSKLKIFTRSTETNHVLNNKFGHPLSTANSPISNSHITTSTSSTNINGYNNNNSSNHSDIIQSTSSNKKTLQQSYVELKDEHKEFRRRMESLEVQRKQEIADLKAALLDATGGLEEVDLRSTHSHYHPHHVMSSSSSSGINSNSSNNNSNSMNHDNNINTSSSSSSSLTFTDSKVNYIRGMLLQYLSCKDPIVKPHIEHALMAIFRYNEQERAVIMEGHKNESQDAISAITNFLGTSIINNFT